MRRLEKNKSRIESSQLAKARSNNRFEILDSMSDNREVHEDENVVDCMKEVILEPRKARVVVAGVAELMKTLKSKKK